VRVGEFQNLKIARVAEHGLYLTDGESDVLLPRNQCDSRMRIDDVMRVFVYNDSLDRPVATTRSPLVTVGQFARLKVVSTNEAGAFLDWGLEKDLFCPIREQIVPMKPGAWAFVRVYLDEISKRLVCTSRWKRFVTADGSEFQIGQKVSVIIAEKAADFVTAIIDYRVRATLFSNEWHERIEVGDVRDAYIKSVREDDHKIALSLRPQTREAVLSEKDRVLNALRENKGVLRLSDKSSPEDIQAAFGLSKGAFKKLLGALYKEGLIEIEPHTIRLKNY